MEGAEAPSTSQLGVDAPALFKKRSAKSKPNYRKRAPTPPPAASDSDSGYTSTEDENGRATKRRRRNAGVTASSLAATKGPVVDVGAPTVAADRSTTIATTNDATKHSNWYDEDGKDALSAKNLLGTTRVKPDATSDPGAQGTYKGAANYQSFIQKNPNGPSRQVGPVKAPTNIRTITVTDFAPDVCKDYKQTGFCGFGDSCKFLHAREDYKQGWELDRDWEIGTKGKKLKGQTVASANRSTRTAGDEDDEADEDAMLENIPFACIICKKPYKNPIITKCGHYFCEDCALQRYRKNPACAACGAGTGGVFNGAKNLRKLLDRKRERAKKRREKEKEEGGEVNEDEDDEAEEDDE